VPRLLNKEKNKEMFTNIYISEKIVKKCVINFTQKKIFIGFFVSFLWKISQFSDSISKYY